MRALTQEEYDVLRVKSETLPGDPDRARIIEVCLRLTARGCYVRTREDGKTVFAITPLGRLALRVSRPEQAMGLP